VNEALCCGLPVISSNVGGIAELINNSNGILVENENIDQLAKAMATYLQNPDRFNQQLISTSASAMFNYHFIGNEIMQLYKEVLKGN
jgi:glycosyltransferase involved in cell wall biosynthesis